MGQQAAVYCRISDDHRGRGAGVTRQREDCIALAAARDWTVERVYVDNDLSAYSGKPRPSYRQLMSAIRAGTLDVVLAWHPDRLHRSPLELEEFIAAVEEAGVAVETVQAGQWDLSTPSGRFMARNLGNAARYESEHKSERVKRALAQSASAGTSHGAVAYGWQRLYTPDGTFTEVAHPQEAEVVREVSRRLLAGESVRSLTADLNARGLPSPRGKEWGKNMVRHLALRERNAGLRVYRGTVVGAGAWPALVSEQEHERLVATLRDPRRRTSQSSTAVHLLSGIARCGVCGASIRAAMNRTILSYRCSQKACVSRRLQDVDDLVVDVVLARLARPDAAQLLTKDASKRQAAAAEVQQLRTRLDVAADDYADGKIDARQLERITSRLRPAIAAAEQRAYRVDDASPLEGLAGNDRVEEVWEGLTLQQRRAVISTLVKVEVLRSSPGRRSFDPASVRISRRSPLDGS